MDPSRLAPRTPAQAHRRRVGVAVALLAVVALLVLALRPGPDSRAAVYPPTSTASTDAAATPSDPQTHPSPNASGPGSPTPSTTRRTLPAYTSTGEFAAAPATDTVRGTKGELITYRVEVEKGSGVRVEDFAAAIDRTLRNPRGWTAGGHWRFQRVRAGHPDLIIRLATPKSVDRQCAAAGANTRGYTSCRTGRYILVNLDRWYVGVPHIHDLGLYRHYLINHEVGHGLGKGHQSCPAKGEPAPVMLQQTLDLEGCTANAWPRGTDGRPVSGPPAP